MVKIDIRLNEKMIECLRSFIGKRMIRFSCERIDYTSSVYGMVVFQIEDHLYRFMNQLEVMDHFNQVEDVGVFRFEETNENSIREFLEGGTMTDTPIDQKISKIQILNENQQLYQNGVQTHDLNTVRGVVFILEDGREVSLEKEVWFSEMITVKTGHHLLDSFDSMDDFLENWENSPDYEAKGSRDCITMQ